MGERLLCKQEVIGSIPFTSTTGHGRLRHCAAAAATGLRAARREPREAVVCTAFGEEEELPFRGDPGRVC